MTPKGVTFKNMTRLYFLNEFNLPHLLLRRMFGEDIFVLGTAPRIPLLGGVLLRLHTACEKRGIFRDAFDLLPEEKPYRHIATIGRRAEIFSLIEDRVNQYYGFDHWENRAPAYAMAFRHAVCNHVKNFFSAMDAMRRLTEGDGVTVRVSGIPADIKSMSLDYLGDRAGLSIRGSRNLASVVNILTVTVVTIYGVLRIFGWVRPFRSAQSERRFLAADYDGRIRDLRVLRDIVDEDEDLLLVCRNRKRYAACEGKSEGIETTSADHVRIGPGAALGFLRTLLTDSWHLFLVGRKQPPSVFFEASKFPFRRIRWRAFALTHSPTVFWARDDYSFEHILRTQELRRAGIQSLGVCHGLPTHEIINPSWRYLDFDIYFAFGSALHDRYYGHTWSQRMKVNPIGSTGMTRAQFSRLEHPRDNTIVFFSSVYYERESFLKLWEVARALPGRQVLIKHKPSRQSDGLAGLDGMPGTIPDNVTLTTEDSYELILRHKYVIATTSSIAAEAIQYGATAFVLDVVPADLPFYYRDFEDLCVADGAEIARRIEAIEDGEGTYQRENYSALIEVHARNPFDRIRESIGLSAKYRKAEENAA